MKSIKYCAAFMLMICASLSMTHAQAQDVDGSDIFLGGGLSYGEKLSDLGIQVGGYYLFNEDIRLGGDFTYWLVDSGSDYSNTYFEINGNAHYLFYQENEITLYAIGTLGIHYMSWEYTFMGQSASESDTDLALGIGAGIEYDIGPVLLYGEPRLFLTGFDQLGLNFGVRFGL